MLEIREVSIPPVGLPGILRIPQRAIGLVLFAHGSGSSRLSPRNTAVANALNGSGMATLLFDLLTGEEESDRENVFNIPLLADRLADAIRWTDEEAALRGLPLGLFGASTGAAAALVAAARLNGRISAIVSRGGRPDLAGDLLDQIATPTLLVVGGADLGVIDLNELAYVHLGGPKAMEIVPGATHLFSEPGALEAVTQHAISWFKHHFEATARQERAAARQQKRRAR